MKIALIPPIKNLEYVKSGQCAMALTHLVLTNEEYANFYANLKMYIILDNSAFESQLQGIDDVAKAAKIVGANEIILPDIVGDKDATIQATINAIKWLKKNKLDKSYKLMAVPQGKTEEEWWQCFRTFNDMNEVNVIGLSKLSCPLCFKKSISQSRLFITQEMQINNLRNNNKEYHLLGGSYEILDEMNQHPEWVRSIDTSAPFEFGKARVSLKTAKSDLPKKANLEQEIRPYNRSYVDSNLRVLLEVAA